MIRRYVSIRRQAPVSSVPLTRLCRVKSEISELFNTQPPGSSSAAKPLLRYAGPFLGGQNISAGDTVGYVLVGYFLRLPDSTVF